MAYRVKNWKRFQHFKDRRPPWIKLYRDLLDDPDWHELDADSAKVLVMLWLIASEDDGNLPGTKKLAFRLRISESKTKSLIGKLSHWLEQDDIRAISDVYQSDAPETETETETEESNASRKNGARHALPDDSPILQTLPLRDGSEFSVRQSLVAELEPLYPQVDVQATVREMKGWLVLNTDRRKTRAGIRRFICNWLQSEQDKHGGQKARTL